jgi:glycosyltransferase involved in cell wall biosynthesis
MTIAVHIALPDSPGDISTNFNYQCFNILAGKYAEHHFIFIFDRPFPAFLITQKNITPVLAGPQVKNRLLQHYFYNFKIPRLLNKYNADVFVSTDVCSLRTNVPQCIIIHDLSFLKKENLFDKNDIRYLKRYTRFFLTKAAKIVVLNDHLKTAVAKSYNIEENKIAVADMGIADHFRPLEYQQAELIKDKYTEGKAYFLYFATATSRGNIITLLKAFSIFKKWQKSNMQLLIMFSTANADNTIKDFSSYKYREDVKILSGENTETIAAITASAYAVIHLPSIEISETEGLNVLASTIPLITIDSPFNKSMYKDAALYTDFAEKDIAEKMMLVYKDENVAKDLVNKGKEIASAHQWQNTARQLWQTIEH